MLLELEKLFNEGIVEVRKFAVNTWINVVEAFGPNKRILILNGKVSHVTGTQTTFRVIAATAKPPTTDERFLVGIAAAESSARLPFPFNNYADQVATGWQPVILTQDDQFRITTGTGGTFEMQVIVW